jgi:hypothetical protein
MWGDIKRLYADSRAFALALPVLFSIPVLIEFGQHVVEIDLGFYRHGLIGAAAYDQRLLTFAFAKMLAMLLPGYWFVRYMAWRRDVAQARRVDRPAAALFAVQFGLQAVAHWLTLFGPPIGVILGLDARGSNYATVVTVVGAAVIGIYLTAWLTAWPLGNARIGPLRSIALIAGSFWRTVAYVAAGTLPLMILHYALGVAAIGRQDWIVWSIMTLDALVVGFLALTVAGANYLAAKRAADRSGIRLAGGEAG